MIPCVSINPQRADAIAELERCTAKGARLVKIHPPTQGVDLADKRHTAFFRRCADLKVVVMVHTGHEHSTPIIDVGLADPRKLESRADVGCTVVACHCGTGWREDKPGHASSFLAMVRKHNNLWGDTAVLGSAQGSAIFAACLPSRPTPRRGRVFSTAATFRSCDAVGFRRHDRVEKGHLPQAIENWMEQDFALKDMLGIGRPRPRNGPIG